MKAAFLFFVFAFFIFFQTQLFAQASRVAAAARRVEDFNQQSEKAARDAMNREMRGRRPTKEELVNSARIKAETKEDLEGLQAQYNLIVETLSGGSVPPEFSAEALSKIHKNASRLRSNIAFPKSEEGITESPIQIPNENRKRLRELGTRIYEFLTNPMIENPNVLDLKAAESARRSLDLIVKLSADPAAS